jgi:AraC family transcriptional regulator of adaptative response / DNA-3-methyladenine glycosylase II
MAHIARAAGFGSVRRFNAVMQEVYGCPPTSLRRDPSKASSGLELQVPVEASFPWTRMLEFIEPWTASGVEQIVDDRYYRIASFGQVAGEVPRCLWNKRRSCRAPMPSRSHNASMFA